MISSLLKWLITASPLTASRVGTLLIGLGLLLLTAGGGYFGYAAYQIDLMNRAGLDESVASPAEAMVPPPGVALREPPPVFEVPLEVAVATPRISAPPVSIRIPAIQVDSRVVGLGTTTDEHGALAWETPKHAVGHHQGTANPGETGNVVFSGHINSPIRQEGNVFSKLPRVKLGDEVIVETIEGAYLYRVVARRVVEPTEVGVMAPTAGPVATLITCYPDWVFSHRLVLTAEQVAFLPFRGTGAG